MTQDVERNANLVEWVDGETPVNASNLNAITNKVISNSNDINTMSQAMVGLQPKNDNSLETTNKNVPSAINELKREKIDKVTIVGNVLKFHANNVEKYSITLPTNQEVDLSGITNSLTTKYDNVILEGQNLKFYVGDILKKTITLPTGEGGSVDLSAYQTKNDSTLNTTDKTIVGGINEIGSKVIDIETSIGNKDFIYLTQQEYDALIKKDSNTLYFITDSENVDKKYVDDKLAEKAKLVHRHNAEDILDFKLTSKKVVKKFVFSGNKTLQPASIDLTSGIISFTEPHGLVGSEKIMIVKNDINSADKFFKYIPKELVTVSTNGWHSTFVVIVENETSIKLALSKTPTVPITFTADSQYTEDLTKWHLELCNDSAKKITINDISFSNLVTDKFKLIIRSGGTVRKISINNNALSRIWINPNNNQIPNFSKSAFNPNLIAGDSGRIYEASTFLDFYYSIEFELFNSHIEAKNIGHTIAAASEYPRAATNRFNETITSFDTCDNLTFNTMEITAMGYFANNDEVLIMEI